MASCAGAVRGNRDQQHAGAHGRADGRSARLIVKAWTTIDGPFNWEGRFYHRSVNVGAPYQQPHPPIWITCKTRARFAGRRARPRCGHVSHWLRREAHLRHLPQRAGRHGRDGTKTAGTPRWCTSATTTSARWTARASCCGISAPQGPPQFKNPPGIRRGTTPPSCCAAARRSTQLTARECIEEGIVFAGTPDEVFAQSFATATMSWVRQPLDDGASRFPRARRHRGQHRAVPKKSRRGCALAPVEAEAVPHETAAGRHRSRFAGQPAQRQPSRTSSTISPTISSPSSSRARASKTMPLAPGPRSRRAPKRRSW